MTEILQRSELDMTGYNVGEDVAMQGQIALRWRKLTYANGTLIATEYHRAMIEPLMDIDGFLDGVEADLAAQGWPWAENVISLDRQIISTLANMIWTENVVAAFEARRQAEEQQANNLATLAAQRLPRWKFWAALGMAGLTETVRAAFAAIPDPQQRAIAVAKLENTDYYDRSDALFADEALLGQIGIDSAGVDALWAQALALPD
jgi:hypothetical protein